MSPVEESTSPRDEETGIVTQDQEVGNTTEHDEELGNIVTPVEEPVSTEPPVRELEDGETKPKDRQVRINVPDEDIPMDRMDIPTRTRESDELSVGSKTTLGSLGGRRKKVKHFNLTDLNRYGTIESSYLCESNREERIEKTDLYVKRVKDIHFVTQSEVNSMKKALRIQITEDYEGVPEMIGKIKIKVCNSYVADSKGLAGPSGDQLCYCGKPKEDEKHQAFSESKEWISSRHTKDVKTNAWGKLALAGCQANFVRLCEDTSMKRIEELLMNVYKMKKPGVIVSVLGLLNFILA